MKSINIEDLHDQARRTLPRLVYDYLAGGALDERTLKTNRDAFQQWQFCPRRLVDLRHIDISAPILGEAAAFPAVVAPTGLNALFWPEGDLALARAAAHSHIPFTLSTASSLPLEHIAQHAGGRLWYQLYVIEPVLAQSLVERAKNTGYECLVVTTDVVVNGKRERDMRNQFALPVRWRPSLIWDGMRRPGWSWRYLKHGLPVLGNFNTPEAKTKTARAALLSRAMDASFDWEALDRIRQQWPGRMLVKGVLHPEDIRHCQAMGMDGVVLSNHGGRQLDDSRTALDVLTELPPMPGFEILMDGGIRRGSDIAKAVALGASAVMIGRAALYGLASSGQVGVQQALDILQDEYRNALIQLGCPSSAQLGRQYLHRNTPSPSLPVIHPSLETL
ncbi:alpha-hydroxy-acid oxidizing protein [Pusillimonas sp. CC-YST705]|uniref:Alpha-hydroxy-acid oxidizing protein n=1 Tax=Mesopusillimonas faecipullorum TaxID=2755040 RepID=A0ABS8CE45_9BURK|nr:alpha-hydroxy-acid oxidizing protein [Mesopusillimonas faecipullorum]MCB5364273.1 alpha-hydroxy-acid oxidizing protein [Mesopusillimonas faecipullorum]